MSCRHDLANTTCARCYPHRGGLDSNGLPQIDPGPGATNNLDGLGASRKPLVIYHGPGCMDGAAAALAAWLKFGEDAEYRPAQYGDPAPTDEECRGRDVYVLDFSYPRAELERMDFICDNASGANEDRPSGRLLVLDHHKTAQADLAGLPFCTFDMGESGAMLAWEHFHRQGGDFMEEIPELFAYVQDRDLWRWELPHSREISAALASSGALMDFRKLIEIYRLWASNNNPGELFGKSVLIAEGAAILRAERLMVERIVATAEEVVFKRKRCFANHICNSCNEVHALAATSAVLQSEVGEALALESARRGRDAAGAVYYLDGKAGKWRVSLRSRDTPTCAEGGPEEPIRAPDVSAIAKSFGGGGHARAAGFECKILPWQEEPQ